MNIFFFTGTANSPACSPLRAALLIVALATLVHAPSARAQYGLVMEPVINQVPYSPTDTNVWPVSWFLSEPGQVYTYAAGYPRDPIHDSFNIVNDTPRTITGMALHIVGTSDATEEPWVLSIGAPTDAIFGDVTGDRRIRSDVFRTITLSQDRKFILLTDGVLPPGARFTDISLAALTRVREHRSGGAPLEQFAAIDSSFLAGNYFAGDLTGDAVVDQADVDLAQTLARNLRPATPCEIAAGDLNRNGVIDRSDVEQVRKLARSKPHRPESDRRETSN